MNSLDTNILLYALDRASPAHQEAFAVYRRLFTEPEAWILSDQTLFELYRALRNSRILQRPLTPRKAIEQIEEIRSKSQCMHVAYESSLWPTVIQLLENTARKKGLLVFDAVLAATLHAAGVTRFYTRNTKDFQAFGLFEVIDPIA